MPFGLRTRVSPKNHVLDGVKIPMGRGNFEGAPTVKYRDTAVRCAKTAEPIEMPFGRDQISAWERAILSGKRAAPYKESTATLS